MGELEEMLQHLRREHYDALGVRHMRQLSPSEQQENLSKRAPIFYVVESSEESEEYQELEG